MTKEPVKEILKNIGLTDKETEIYVFLAKFDSLKGLEIARRTRIDRAEVYRILRSLQSKGLVESTIELPARFTIIPFEKVLDSFVKARQDELALIARAKQDLLEDWKKISRAHHEPGAERFSVIEGDRKIYPKIFQMFEESEEQLSVISPASKLLHAFKSSFFDASSEHGFEGQKFRLLTEVSKENVKIAKGLLESLSDVGFAYRGRSPDLGIQLSPQMVIKDDKEILVYITPTTDKGPTSSQGEVCMWTNCRALVQSFTGVFENLWNKSSDINKKIGEVETGSPLPQSYFMCNRETVMNKYHECLLAAKKEIMIMSPSENLTAIDEDLKRIKDGTAEDRVFKIMAPITTQNLNLVRRLSEFSEVRHIPETNSTTVLIDKKHFFEFSNSLKEDSKAEVPSFQSSFYTDHADYVEKAKLKLNSIWNSAQAPSRVTLETILGLQAPLDSSLPGKVQRLRKIKSTFQYTEYEEGLLTEKDVIRKIMNAKRIPARDPLKDINAMYGAEATGIIHPPSELGLPDMLVTASHFNKQSSWGAEDTLYVYLNLETPKGNAFVPVAVVTDNPKSVEWRRGVFSGTPAAQNIILFKKNQLRVQLQGNTLFAGWTKSIPLSASPYTLPPCCLVFEGQGDIKTCRMKSSITCGRTQVLELNWYDASVTFFHPSSKYSGPGTDACIHREHVMMGYPPTGN